MNDNIHSTATRMRLVIVKLLCNSYKLGAYDNSGHT